MSCTLPVLRALSAGEMVAASLALSIAGGVMILMRDIAKKKDLRDQKLVKGKGIFSRLCGLRTCSMR